MSNQAVDTAHHETYRPRKHIYNDNGSIDSSHKKNLKQMQKLQLLNQINAHGLNMYSPIKTTRKTNKKKKISQGFKNKYEHALR